jgi:hypothetical protein
MDKEAKEINQLTKYLWSTDDLLVRITTLEKSDDILSKECKSKLNSCKKTVLSLRNSISDRISKIMISIYIK